VTQAILKKEKKKISIRRRVVLIKKRGKKITDSATQPLHDFFSSNFYLLLLPFYFFKYALEKTLGFSNFFLYSPSSTLVTNFQNIETE
jgi:hypothetical protein